MDSRRQFGKTVLVSGAGVLACAQALRNAAAQVRTPAPLVGVHTFSFSTLPRDGILDAIIGCMVDVGIGECILLAQQIEPADLWEQVRASTGDAQALAREKLGKWRMSVSLDYFKEIRRKFENAGVAIQGFGAS